MGWAHPTKTRASPAIMICRIVPADILVFLFIVITAFRLYEPCTLGASLSAVLCSWLLLPLFRFRFRLGFGFGLRFRLGLRFRYHDLF